MYLAAGPGSRDLTIARPGNEPNVCRKSQVSCRCGREEAREEGKRGRDVQVWVR